MLDRAVDKCAASGFLTGFGGFLTLPINVPANLSSVLYVQLRMIAASVAKAGKSSSRLALTWAM